MSILITIIIFSILVISHEYGHFVAARQAGVRVEKFSIGFGPAIVKIKSKETEFLICLIPLGGYVKLAGDDRSQCKGLPFEFFSKPLGVRARIVFFGSFFNIILTFIIFWVIFAIFGFPSSEAVVGDVIKYKSVAKSKFKTEQLEWLKKNRIIQEADIKEKYAVWPFSVIKKEEVKSAGFNDSDTANLLHIWRNSSRITSKGKFSPKQLQELVGRNIVKEKIVYWTVKDEKELLLRLNKSSASDSRNILAILGKSRLPAYRAGIEKDDKILKVNGEEARSWDQMTKLIRESKDVVELTILRNKNKRDIKVIPRRVWVMTVDGEREISQVGILPKVIKANIAVSFAKALGKVYGSSKDILKGFYALFAKKISFKKGVAGPIGIVYYTAKVAKFGVIPLLEFLAMLSLVLAIVNLSPFPVLDGGHLFFILIEKFRKGPLSPKWENKITQAGLAAIILLTLFVGYNDIINFVFKQPELNQRQFSILKDKGMVKELSDDGKYVFWTVSRENDLISKLSKSETLNSKDILAIWWNSPHVTRVAAK